MSPRNSIVGSSWDSAETSGEAPMSSPALSRIEFFACDSSVLTCVARNAAPPASTGSAPPPITTRPLDPAGGCRFPVEVVDADQPDVHRPARRLGWPGVRRGCAQHDGERRRSQDGEGSAGETCCHARLLTIGCGVVEQESCQSEVHPASPLGVSRRTRHRDSACPPTSGRVRPAHGR